MTKEEVAQVIAYCDENKFSYNNAMQNSGLTHGTLMTPNGTMMRISCKELDLDPRERMEDVLLQIPGNEKSQETLRKLLPDQWTKRSN